MFYQVLGRVQHCPGEGNEVHEDKGEGCWYLIEMETKWLFQLRFSEEVLLHKAINISWGTLMNRLVTKQRRVS